MLQKIFKISVYIFAIIGFILVVGFFAVNMGLTNTKGVIDRQNDYFQNKNTMERVGHNLIWAKGAEWETFREAVKNDSHAINTAGKSAGVSARLIVAILAVEQLRLYHTNRALFETVFAPLKLLGNQVQFSWGVMGIKQETAEIIESNLKDVSSPFYLGKEYENILDFEKTDKDKQRFQRLTDEDDRYYSYLYAGLYLKQVQTQWKRAGFDISDSPEILATLFNIGFENSKPKANPQTGGSSIKIGESVYSFGSIAKEIYYSDELIETFQR